MSTRIHEFNLFILINLLNLLLISVIKPIQASSPSEVRFNDLCKSEYLSKYIFDETRDASRWRVYLSSMDQRISLGHSLGIYQCPAEIIEDAKRQTRLILRKGAPASSVGELLLDKALDSKNNHPRKTYDAKEKQSSEGSTMNEKRNQHLASSNEERFNQLCEIEYQSKYAFDKTNVKTYWALYLSTMDKRIALGHSIRKYQCPPATISNASTRSNRIFKTLAGLDNFENDEMIRMTGELKYKQSSDLIEPKIYKGKSKEKTLIAPTKQDVKKDKGKTLSSFYKFFKNKCTDC